MINNKNTEITISPCEKCVKSDVCKYKEEIDELVFKINCDFLANVEILETYFICKKATTKNGNSTYRGLVSKDNEIMLCNKENK
jgi:hypothetical protein